MARITSIYSVLAFLALAALAAALPDATTRPMAVSPVILPAPQTSVTSTAFNPDIQNAGGTTNSAGTFDVQSLARSSNYVYDSSIPQTTSYVVQSAAIAGQADQSTPGYYSNVATESSAIVVSQIPASRVTSIPTSAGTSSASYTPSAINAAVAISPSTTSALGTVILMGTAAVLGAVFVL